MPFWLGKRSSPCRVALDILQHPEADANSSLFEKRISKDSDPLKLLKPSHETYEYKPENKVEMFINDTLSHPPPLHFHCLESAPETV